jgi:hypothetical protein
MAARSAKTRRACGTFTRGAGDDRDASHHYAAIVRQNPFHDLSFVATTKRDNVAFLAYKILRAPCVFAPKALPRAGRSARHPN